MGVPKQGDPFESAVRLLASRAHSRAELKRKLLAKGFLFKDVSAALAECERLGFLDDSRFASSLAEEMKSRGSGPRKIMSAMFRKGVAKELAEEAVDSSGAAKDEIPCAMEALKRKLKSLEREPEPMKRREKALRFLASRGFSPSASFEAMERLGLGSAGGRLFR